MSIQSDTSVEAVPSTARAGAVVDGATTDAGRAAAVGSGASNAEVAASLFMSEATVKAHVSRLLTKLAVTNRVQLAILVHDARS